jgi:hypothetical protein
LRAKIAAGGFSMEAYLGRLIPFSLPFGIFYLGLATWWLLRRVKRTPFKKIMLGFVAAGLFVPVVTLPVWDLINGHVCSSGRGTMESVGLAVWPTSIMLMALEGSPSLGTTIIICGLSTVGNVGIYGTVGLIAGLTSVGLHNLQNARREK